MSTSQRVSRGFHRLAFFLAAIPLLVGGAWVIIWALNIADSARRSHDEQAALVCAQKQLANAASSDQPDEKSHGAIKLDEVPGQPGRYILPPGWTKVPPSQALTFDDLVPSHDLKALGCSEMSRKVSERDILDAHAPADFSYASALLTPLATGLAITLAISLAVYGLVRAIGWVIGGFAAS